MKNIISRIFLLSVFVALSSSNVLADNIIIQSSTSLKNSGFYRYLAPILKQYTGVEIYKDYVSNGFKIRASDTDTNGNGRTYIYMALGQTMVGSNDIPATAR